MRADLQDALEAVNWANAHIPVLKERFISWQRRGPYEAVMEPDPDDGEWEKLVIRQAAPLDPLINGDLGAIINSARTGLDLLMSAILASNGIKSNRNANFPIRASAADFYTAVNIMERKKWLSAAEVTAIKDTRAYKGGDPVLYSIHQLDILRKHERLLAVEPVLQEASTTLLIGFSVPILEVTENKTALFRIPKGRFRPTKGNTFITSEILLNEVALLTTKLPAIDILRKFIDRIRTLIKGFPCRS